MKIPKRCVVCGDENISDTSMNITLHTVKYEVFLCDKHEDTSPAEAKKHLMTVLDQLDALMDQASEFGYELVLKSELENMKNNASTAGASRPKPSKPNANSKIVSGDGNTVAPQIIGGDAADMSHSAGINLSSNQNQAISELAKAPKEVITVSDNTRVIKDQTGETTITINQGFSDKELQKLAKLEEEGVSVKRRTCALCKGSGILAMNSKSCPKCNGTGQIITT